MYSNFTKLMLSVGDMRKFAANLSWYWYIQNFLFQIKSIKVTHWQKSSRTCQKLFFRENSSLSFPCKISYRKKSLLEYSENILAFNLEIIFFVIFQSSLTTSNYETIIGLTCHEIATRYEKVAMKCSFNRVSKSSNISMGF